MKSYKTLKRYASEEFVERKSLFIGYVDKVEDEDGAIEFIEKIKRKHSDATHNVYAYNLREQNIARFSDAGEPQGTAGLPALDVLRKGDIVDAVIVVTRYFGGIMLGAGGLIRAYTTAAKLAVDSAGVDTMAPHRIYTIIVDYPSFQRISAEMEKLGGSVIETDFSDTVKVKYAVSLSNESNLNSKISELTNGKSDFEDNGIIYRPLI